MEACSRDQRHNWGGTEDNIPEQYMCWSSLVMWHVLLSNDKTTVLMIRRKFLKKTLKFQMEYMRGRITKVFFHNIHPIYSEDNHLGAFFMRFDYVSLFLMVSSCFLILFLSFLKVYFSFWMCLRLCRVTFYFIC